MFACDPREPDSSSSDTSDPSTDVQSGGEDLSIEDSDTN